MRGADRAGWTAASGLYEEQPGTEECNFLGGFIKE